MNSIERVIKTINHQEPDRVPTGEWGIDHDHVSKIIGHHTYWRNRKDITLALWEGRRDEVVESMKNDYSELIEKLDYDILTVELVPPKADRPKNPPKKTGDGIWEDLKGNVYKYAASNDSIVCLSSPDPKEELFDEDIDKSMNRKIDETEFELVDFICDKYGKEKIVLCRNIDIYDSLMAPFGGDQIHQLMLPLVAPDEIKKMYKSALEWNKKLISHLQKKNVQIAMQGYDLAMNTGTMMSPDTLRDIYFPFIRMVNEEIEKNGMIPFFHCCGNTWEILDDFVNAGYKGYQSIQKSAKMDTFRMKQKYGNLLAMWTGIQCETLIQGSKADVENEVREYLDICMPGGGFIFGSTNTVQYGANTDNYLRAMEIVRNEGIYK